MKIFYYSGFEAYGGLENYGLNLIRATRLVRPDIDFVILCSTKKCIFEKEFVDLGCEIVFLPSFIKSPLKFCKALSSTLAKGDVRHDIIQLNLCSDRNFLLFHVCKKSGLRTIRVAHYTKPHGKFMLLHYFNRIIYDGFGIKIAVSKKAAKAIYKKQNNVQIIDNGIDVKQFLFKENNRNAFRKKLNLTNQTVLIGQVGRISKEKNQEFSLSIIKSLSLNNDTYKLCILGSGDTGSLKNIVEKENLGDKVLFAECNPKDISSWYSAFDLLILPSKHEAAPLVVCEGLANGLKCICSTNVPKIDIDGVVWLDLHTDFWVNRIKKFQANDELIHTPPCENIRKYDFIKSVEKYIKLYEQK